jgi:hypothetical protein
LRIPEVILDYPETTQVKWHVLEVLRKQQDGLPGGVSQPELIKDIWVPSRKVREHNPGSRHHVPYVIDNIAGPEQAVRITREVVTMCHMSLTILLGRNKLSARFGSRLAAKIAGT